MRGDLCCFRTSRRGSTISFTARHSKSPYSADLAGGSHRGPASFTADTKAGRRLRKVPPLTTKVDGPDAPQGGPVSKRRRTVRDHERLTARCEAMILRAMIALVTRRLAATAH